MRKKMPLAEKRVSLIMARLKKGYEQTEVANNMEVTQQTYSGWETGRATPSAKKMAKLEKVLGVPKEKLFPDVFGDDPDDQKDTA
jgi:transcriptional regulator with XRE-family HTH domain